MRTSSLKSPWRCAFPPLRVSLLGCPRCTCFQIWNPLLVLGRQIHEVVRLPLRLLWMLRLCDEVQVSEMASLTALVCFFYSEVLVVVFAPLVKDWIRNDISLGLYYMCIVSLPTSKNSQYVAPLQNATKLQSNGYKFDNASGWFFNCIKLYSHPHIRNPFTPRVSYGDIYEDYNFCVCG